MRAALAAAPPPVHAAADEIVDARTGEVLAAERPHAHLPIASITKLMTMIVALKVEHEPLDRVVAVDPRAAAVGEESISLRAGERLTVRDLVEGALIQSANDAADALALSVAPSFPAFARLMNAEARRLGLHDSHVVRADDLDETGHTDEAGWCQVTAVRGRGLTLYATLLGSPSRTVRDDDLAQLLAWGLGQFQVVPALAPGRAYAHVRLPYGRAPLALVPARGLEAVARVGRGLTVRVVAPVSVALPVRRGEALGRVVVTDGARLVGSRPLVASRSVARPGLAARVGWYAGRAFHHVLGWVP